MKHVRSLMIGQNEGVGMISVSVRVLSLGVSSQ